MTPTILLLTGNCGVGKTTIARAWATRRRGAAIHGNDIRWWMTDKARRWENSHQHLLCARLSADAAEAFVEMGLDVAIECVWQPSSLALLKDRLSPIASMRMVWLECELAENHRRDEQRSPNAVMGPRVETLRAELNAIADWPAEMRRIETTGMSIDAVVDRCDFDR